MKNINVSKKVIDIYKKLHLNINKNIVYGIKKKDNNYRLELYLYRKNFNNHLHCENYINETIN